MRSSFIPVSRAVPGRFAALGLISLFATIPLILARPGGLLAQQIQTESAQVITVAKGKSALTVHGTALQRVTVADPEIAEPVAVSPRELLVNGKAIGTTSLIVWSETGQATIYAVEVTADAAQIERQLRLLFPDTDLSVTATGNNVILSGHVRDATIARRAMEIASASGATVVNNLAAPSAEQILLQVRFAEVSRTAAQQLGSSISAFNIGRLDPNAPGVDQTLGTLSEGLVKLFLAGDNTKLEATIQALKSRGEFRSLAEPNLLALEGQTASFLAGGEFPFPVIQGTSGGTTIVWKEFGIRLNFVPHVTNTGSVRLAVEPEVSSLDFANGLTISGFRIPSILSRRAKTEVELRPGQHLAIAGLLDNSILSKVDKIPLLGDIPILGALFRSKDAKQNRTELLVLVTPHIVHPLDVAPEIPTGEPAEWRWMRGLRPQDIGSQSGPPRGGTNK
jgi:pilus assembly protein CpaC